MTMFGLSPDRLASDPVLGLLHRRTQALLARHRRSGGSAILSPTQKARARAPQGSGQPYVVVPYAQVRDELRTAMNRYVGKAANEREPFSRKPVVKYFRPAKASETGNLRYTTRPDIDAQGLAGCANRQEDTVYINATMPVARAVRVLYHEVFHLRGGVRALDEAAATRWATENAPY